MFARSRLRPGAACAAIVSVMLAMSASRIPADAHGTTVSVSQAAGTRQLSVEDLTGQDLSSLQFGTGGSTAFRVRVSDSAYTVTNENFTVNATMNRLYKKNGAGYLFGTVIPSSAVAVGFRSNPLAATGVSVV